MKKTLIVRRETLRLLTGARLRIAVGGVPTGFGTSPCVILEARGTTSENEGAGPCPGEESWTCATG